MSAIRTASSAYHDMFVLCLPIVFYYTVHYQIEQKCTEGVPLFHSFVYLYIFCKSFGSYYSCYTVFKNFKYSIWCRYLKIPSSAMYLTKCIILWNIRNWHSYKSIANILICVHKSPYYITNILSDCYFLIWYLTIYYICFYIILRYPSFLQHLKSGVPNISDKMIFELRWNKMSNSCSNLRV